VDEIDEQELWGRISAAVEKALLSKPRVHLSWLGMLFHEDIEKLRRANGQSLKAFLDKNITDMFKFEVSGENRNVYSIVLSSNFSKMELDQDRESISERQYYYSTRFNFRFWAAFSKPFTSDRRFLDTDTIGFTDVKANETIAGIEIKPSFIPATDLQDRDQAITENIFKWLEENQLSKSKFLANNLKGSYGDNRHNKKSLLEAVIDALDSKELASINLNLSVVARLLNSKLF
jgi:hypothetical protein